MLKWLIPRSSATETPFITLPGFLPVFFAREFSSVREETTTRPGERQIEAWPGPSNKIFESPQRKPIAEFVIIVRNNLTSRDPTSLGPITRGHKMVP